MALEIQSLKNSTTTDSQNAGAKTRSLFGEKKISQTDRMFFLEQLALMLETGSDLHSSLNVLAKQTNHPKLKRVVQKMADDISEGGSFSSALARHPEVFSNTYVSLIAASESGGYIRRILEHLLEMEKQRAEFKSTLVSAISYPVFLMVFSMAMVIFILAVVFPKFGDLFTSIQDQLPATTIFLMGLSHLIINYWWAILISLSGSILLFGFWAKTEMGKRSLDQIKLKIPGLNNLFLKIYLIQTMRVLGLSLANGVSLIDALNLAKDVVKNCVFHDFLNQLSHDVTEGRTLAYGFKTTPFIPPIVQQMITTGEETGKLALVTTRIADFFQKELEKILGFISKAIEPLMLLVMGVIVGLLVSSLILPIFKLSHAVH
jgi:type II secretory pathway component PulF